MYIQEKLNRSVYIDVKCWDMFLKDRSTCIYRTQALFRVCFSFERNWRFKRCQYLLSFEVLKETIDVEVNIGNSF